MSALSTSSSAAPPPAKRTKTQADSTPVPRGVGVAIFSEDRLALAEGERAAPSPCVWVTDGDRTRKVPALWDPWSNEFYASEPHNIYLVPLDAAGNFEPLHVPATPTGEARVFSDEECGRAMLTHAIAKTWLPKCAISDPSKADAILAHLSTLKKNKNKKGMQAYASEVVSQLPSESVRAFLDMCVHYTKLVNAGDGRPYLLLEIVCGTIESGHTADQTAIKEGFEESRAPKEFLRSNLRSTGVVEYVTKYGSKWSGTYTCSVQKDIMEQWWRIEGVRREALTNWFCPHAWFAYLSGLDMDAMEALKGMCEMRNGRWMPIDQAKQLLDAKSLNVLGHVLEH